MPAPSKSKLPPTLFMTAKINIKSRVAVYRVTDSFQDFFTLFPGCCCGTTNCLFWTIGTNWHAGWQSRGWAQRRYLNEHGAWTDLPLEVVSAARTKTQSWRTWGSSHCNYSCNTCSLSKKKGCIVELSCTALMVPSLQKKNVHSHPFLLVTQKKPKPKPHNKDLLACYHILFNTSGLYHPKRRILSSHKLLTITTQITRDLLLWYIWPDDFLWDFQSCFEQLFETFFRSFHHHKLTSHISL